MTKTSSKVAIVTGASRGIGAAIAERLANDGFSVAINYAGSQAEADALAHKIEAKGGRALMIAINLKGHLQWPARSRKAAA